jgi:putative transposase
MARQPRLIVPEQPHHVIQRGNNRQIIYREEADYQRFLVWLKEGARFYDVAIHAYVLMPNHVHLLATPSDATGLALMMQKVGRLSMFRGLTTSTSAAVDCSRGVSARR